MGDAKKKKFDCVLVWRFDRFARSTKELLSALSEFEHLGVDFISFQENLDTSSPMGKCMFTVLSAFSEFELNIIRERVTAGVRNRIKKTGKWGPEKKYDPEKIVELHKKGWSIRKIARKIGCSKSLVQRIVA